jgi:hypothetical protein
MYLILETNELKKIHDLFMGLLGIGRNSPELHGERHIVIDIKSLQKVEALEDHSHALLELS